VGHSARERCGKLSMGPEWLALKWGMRGGVAGLGGQGMGREPFLRATGTGTKHGHEARSTKHGHGHEARSTGTGTGTSTSTGTGTSTEKVAWPGICARPPTGKNRRLLCVARSARRVLARPRCAVHAKEVGSC
jgi:hypothetical protein